MIKAVDLQAGDIIYSDDAPLRSILIVAVRERDVLYDRLDETWEAWWLDRTTASGLMVDGTERPHLYPIGPWTFPEEIPWHRRSEPDVHDANGDPQGD